MMSVSNHIDLHVIQYWYFLVSSDRGHGFMVAYGSLLSLRMAWGRMNDRSGAVIKVHQCFSS